ncbi:MAG: hypothetical protein ACRD51_12910 [Candidatus Acidiferrum sp.]
MSEFKDKIPVAGGKVEFLYDEATGGITTRVSSLGFSALYQVAVSMDGRCLLDIVPVTGLGVVPVYRQPSVLTFIQSDEQGMWGRNCPSCQKYFRTNHVLEVTCCPHCAVEAPSLAFISKDQRTYITACYDAFARAYMGKKSTSVEIADITDRTAAWHYSEEKQQFHFKCSEEGCAAEIDILGEYGYCPRCSRTNARKLFFERIDKMLKRLEEVENAVSDRRERGLVWEEMTKNVVGDFEHLAKHLRVKLLTFPMTPSRRKRLKELNFQKPLQANESLVGWFDAGLLAWPGSDATPKRAVPDTDLPLIKKMIQRRHILIHNGGIVDQGYLDLSGEIQVQLGERIGISSNETKRFIECIRAMAENLLDNVEYGFRE